MELAVRGASAAVLADPRARWSASRILSATRLASRSDCSAGQAPNPFLVGLAVLGLLSEAAEERPLLCVVDDAQWLDRASARALAFVARRLLAERIALVFAARELERRARGLAGAPRRAPRAVGMRGRCWSRSCRRGSTSACSSGSSLETRGNPLALLGAAARADAGAARGRVRPARGAAPVGRDRGELHAAAGEASARRAALAARGRGRPGRRLRRSCGGRRSGSESRSRPREHRRSRTACWRSTSGVVFRHPLVRSAVYRAAGPKERREVHRALAEATDPEIDPDRRAWHRAQAASSARRGRRRGARAFRRTGAGARRFRGRRRLPRARRRADARARAPRAARCSPPPARSAMPARWTARSGCSNGVDAGLLDELGRARVDLLRGQIALEQRRGGDAGRLFLSAASTPRAARPRAGARDVPRGARRRDVQRRRSRRRRGSGRGGRAGGADRSTAPPRAADVLLDAFAIRLTDGYAAAAPTLARGLELLLRSTSPTRMSAGWLSLSSSRDGNIVALELWDDEAVHLLAARQVQARPRRGRARAPAVRAQLPGQEPPARRRADGGRAADRRSPPDR